MDDEDHRGDQVSGDHALLHDPRGDQLFPHQVTLDWELSADAIDWCQTRVEWDLEYRFRWETPWGRPMRYRFSFAREEDAVEFKLVWL